MPLNEIPKHLGPECRRLVDAVLEDAWQTLSKDSPPDAEIARMKLERTIVILVSVGETNFEKLKWFALHAARGAVQAGVAFSDHQQGASQYSPDCSS